MQFITQIRQDLVYRRQLRERERMCECVWVYVCMSVERHALNVLPNCVSLYNGQFTSYINDYHIFQSAVLNLKIFYGALLMFFGCLYSSECLLNAAGRVDAQSCQHLFTYLIIN
ncbi:hypothetical protein BpHYR1_027655 [Brachionus plicatilis]|uniref:Uncharacterized protein n=1 Tax=Brachionus plicatilis TaxID=10195 RepID=A0A3M7S3F9_BRAPC|nr:hypothetical protein BpHYR1_027655 [Brachionus plicatilis]